MRELSAFIKPLIMKKPGFIFVGVLMLFLVTGTSNAAPAIDSGELRVGFGINSDYSGFFFDGLTLDFNADLSANYGVRGEFNFVQGYRVETIAYYYLHDLFRDDEVNIGRFSIEWASDQSETMNGSLAQKVQWQGGVVAPADPGFNKGIGVKYKTSFNQFALVGSVSNDYFGEGTDLVGRGAFKLNPELVIGVGLASINRAKQFEASDFALLIDADFTSGPLNLLGEVVSVNSRKKEQKETNVGFYAEAAYDVSPTLLFYGGFYGAEDLIDDLVVVGGKTRINPHATIQGEIQNTRDDWNLIVGLSVNF